MILYKMKYYFSRQPWYNGSDYFIFIKKNHQFSPFDADCRWENIITGEVIDNWNYVMEKLPIEESKEVLRELLINKIIS